MLNKTEVKMDGDGETKHLQHLLRVETIEGVILYINSVILEAPPVDKIKFCLGTIHAFKEDLQIRCYKCELVSMDCLNREMEWNQKYYDRIHSSLERRIDDIVYSLTSGDEEAVACDYVLRISERLKLNAKSQTQTEVCLMKAYLRQVPQMSNLDTFYRLCLDQLQRRNRTIQQLEGKVNQVSQQRQKLQSDLEHISQQCKEREKVMLKKFVLLLNSKKQELRHFNQMNGLLNHNIYDRMNEEFQVPEQAQPQPMMAQSQYMVSQQLSPSMFFSQKMENVEHQQQFELPQKKTRTV